MADAVTARLLSDTAKQTIVHLTCVSDGTGESAVVKVDKSALVPASPVGTTAATEAVSLEIGAVRWAIQGFTSVKLAWDHTTDDVALVLSGSGYEDFVGPGMERGDAVIPLLTDPRSAGGAGDIVLTSVGASATATYDITLWLRKANA